jgi:toxin ParE1/3/4
MSGYKLSAQAGRDYREILSSTLDRWGVDQFEKYASILDDAFDRVAKMPMLGLRRDDIRPGFYRYQVGQHYIFYRIGKERIEIARILHTRRNASSSFFDDLTF